MGKFLLIFFLSAALWMEGLYVTDKSVTLSWDEAEDATSYEIKPVWVNADGIKQEYNVNEVTGTTIIIHRIRTGFFEFYARSKMIVGPEYSNEGEILFGDWVKSIDPKYATVNGVAKGWRVYFDLPAPESGGII